MKNRKVPKFPAGGVHLFCMQGEEEEEEKEEKKRKKERKKEGKKGGRGGGKKKSSPSITRDEQLVLIFICINFHIF